MAPGRGSEDVPKVLFCPSIWKQLPSELLEMVFKRLPFGSLMNYRAVSKGWNSLISSPGFGRDCEAMLSLKPVPILLPLEIRPGCNSIQVFSSDCWRPLELVLPKIRGFPLKLTASSGGLLCLETKDRRRLIVNPLTGRHRLVELPHSPRGGRNNLIDRRQVLTGLVVDHQTGSFKLVVVSLVEKAERRTLLYDSSDGSWRSGAPVPEGLHFESLGALTCKGNIYCVVALVSNRSYKVLKYNVGTDSWCEVVLNVERPNSEIEGVDLMEHQSEVVLVSTTTDYGLNSVGDICTALFNTLYQVVEMSGGHEMRLVAYKLGFEVMDMVLGDESSIVGSGDVILTWRNTVDRKIELLNFNCSTKRCTCLLSKPQTTADGPLEVVRLLEPSFRVDL